MEIHPRKESKAICNKGGFKSPPDGLLAEERGHLNGLTSSVGMATEKSALRLGAEPAAGSSDRKLPPHSAELGRAPPGDPGPCPLCPEHSTPVPEVALRSLCPVPACSPAAFLSQGCRSQGPPTGRRRQQKFNVSAFWRRQPARALTQPRWQPSLGRPVSRTGRPTFPLLVDKPPSLGCFVTAARTDQDTHCLPA